MNKLYSSDDVKRLIESFDQVSPHKDSYECAGDLLDRICYAYDEYHWFSLPKTLEKIILLSAEYQYKYMNVDIHTIRNLYGNDIDESEDDDLLKQVHRKILELYY